MTGAVKGTEEALTDLRIEIGKLGDTVGFGIDDVAKVVLPV